MSFQLVASVVVVVALVVVWLVYRSSSTQQEKGKIDEAPSKQPPKEQSKHATKQPKPKATSSPEHQLNVVRIKGFRHTVSCVKFSADGRYLAACSGERQTLVYFASTLLGKDHRWIQVNTDDETLYCDFDSNGNYLVLGLSDTKTVAAFQLLSKKNKEGRLYERKASFGREHKENLKAVLLADNAQFILTCDEATMLKIWSLKGQVIETIDTKQMKNNCMAISPGSRFFAVGAFLPDVKIWEMSYDNAGAFLGLKKSKKGHQNVMDLKGHKSGVRSISFSPDGKRVATASQDGTWKMWNIEVRYELGEDPACLYTNSATPPSESFSHISISPNGNLVATVSGSSVQFWSASRGALIETIEQAHSKSITSLSWNKDSTMLATSSHDSTVALWKLPHVV